MHKNSVAIELTENEARMVAWAVRRAVNVTSASSRGVTLFRSLETAHLALETAVAGLEPVPLPKLNTRK